MIPQLETDLKTAMLARDQLKVSVLKLVKSAAENKRIELGHTLSEEEMVLVLRSEAKKRREAIEMYQKGGAQVAADKEKAELEIIESYLPQGMPESELLELIAEVKKELGDTSSVGQIIGAVMAKA